MFLKIGTWKLLSFSSPSWLWSLWDCNEVPCAGGQVLMKESFLKSERLGFNPRTFWLDLTLGNVLISSKFLSWYLQLSLFLFNYHFLHFHPHPSFLRDEERRQHLLRAEVQTSQTLLVLPSHLPLTSHELQMSS